jgi:hypothetical protein
MRDVRRSVRVIALSVASALATPEMLTSGRGDEPIRRASEQAGVRFLSRVEEFRREAATRVLFFELDGHFNRVGHEVFATLVESAVAARVAGLRDALH